MAATPKSGPKFTKLGEKICSGFKLIHTKNHPNPSSIGRENQDFHRGKSFQSAFIVHYHINNKLYRLADLKIKSVSSERDVRVT